MFITDRMPYNSQQSCRANANHALPSAWRAGINTKINQPKPNNSVRASDVEQATFPVESDGRSTRLKRGGVVCRIDGCVLWLLALMLVAETSHLGILISPIVLT